MEGKKIDRKKDSDAKGEYELEINPFALLIPLGLIGSGMSIYFFVKAARLQMIGLFLVLIGALSLLGIAIPVVQLLKAKKSLQEQERKVKLERIKESVKEKKTAEEIETQ